MKQRTTVLVAKQDDLSRVYEARKQRVIYTRNPVTLLTTENDKFNRWINGIVKVIADQSTQTEENNGESKATFSITSLENERGVEIIFFVLVHNITGSNNGSSGSIDKLVPAPTTGGRGYEGRESAHAWKIIASLNNQSESLSENWSTPTTLEDLQWSDRPIAESYRRHFLENFTRYNEILRAHGNYYAARTSRYTTIQGRLTPCIAVPYDKRKRQDVKDRLTFDSKRLKESQTYRIILADEKSSDNLAVSEIESLRRENELLGQALRRAADLHLSMLNKETASASNLHTREQSLEQQRQALAQDSQELAERKETFERSIEVNASELREQERLLQQQRERLERAREELAAQSERLRQQETTSASNLRTREEALAQERQDLAEWAEIVERSNEANASDLREQERLLEQQRERLERDREELAARSERLRQEETTSASNLRTREQSLERQRQALAQDRQDLAEWAETVEISNEANASELREQERLAAQQRERLERDQRELAEQRERLRRQETASATSRREEEASLEERRRVLEQFEEETVGRRRDFEEYYESRVGNLREREESVEADRRSLEEERRRLSRREDELRRQQNAARSTPPAADRSDYVFGARSVSDGWKGHVKLPLISEPLPWRIKLPWY